MPTKDSTVDAIAERLREIDSAREIDSLDLEGGTQEELDLQA